MIRTARFKLMIFAMILVALAGCQTTAEETPLPAAQITAEPTADIPLPTRTSTPLPTDLPAPPPLPTRTATPLPTDTLVPTEVPVDTPTPTETAVPTGTAVPPSPPQAVNTATSAPPPPPTDVPVPPAEAPNLLPNPSFEEGYTNLYNAPELQVPVGWTMEIDEGGIQAPETGEVYLRPESRIAPRWGIPPDEVGLFVYHGDWTLKVFKGGAPVSFRLFTDVQLEPGTYRFVASYFPDIVAHYNSDGTKIWAPQALAGEVNFINSGRPTIWNAMTVGVKNTMVETFTVTTAGTVRVGVGWRARYIQGNNGFFIDDWSLKKVE